MRVGNGRQMNNLGVRLINAGDIAGARAAFEAAIGAGNSRITGRAAYNLGVLLAGQGEQDRALAAFALAHRHGERAGSFNFGVMTASRGKLAEARTAFLAAARARDKNIARAARVQLAKVDARLQYHAIAAEHGPRTAPLAQINLGVILAEQFRDVTGAREEFRAAAASGHPEAAPVAAYNLGMLLEFEDGDLPGARDAYQAAIDAGHPGVVPVAALKLGKLLERLGDAEGAQAAFATAGTNRAPQSFVKIGRGRDPGIPADFYQYLTCDLGQA